MRLVGIFFTLMLVLTSCGSKQGPTKKQVRDDFEGYLRNRSHGCDKNVNVKIIEFTPKVKDETAEILIKADCTGPVSPICVPMATRGVGEAVLKYKKFGDKWKLEDIN